jgi:hypothetical protein
VVKRSVVSVDSEPVRDMGSAKLPAVLDPCVSISVDDAGPSEVIGSGFTVLKNPFSCYVVTLTWQVKFAFLCIKHFGLKSMNKIHEGKHTKGK